jgi:type IV secretory pathway VirD2 relaxase
MARHLVVLPRTPGLELDLVSHGRRGPAATCRSSGEAAKLARGAHPNGPEVVVKISGGARDIEGALAHLTYIGRNGKLDIETDDGELVHGRAAISRLVDGWQLDLCPSGYRPKPPKGRKDTRAKLLHHIVLSMPDGTPPLTVIAAARAFARQNFSSKYRYAMVLHTDQAHPHVHLCVKSESEYEPGERLCVRRDTLRRWREQFAALMQAQGVAATATSWLARNQREVHDGMEDHAPRSLRLPRIGAGAADGNTQRRATSDTRWTEPGAPRDRTRESTYPSQGRSR